ncbi:MAG: DegV family protein [Coriobacteriales bacterium]|nr:DegV family protein [Actinomycetes bacterium]
MQRVGIVTDSTSDITPEVARELGIEVVPLSVTIGDDTFEDGTLTQREFFDRMKDAPALPTTSQPPVGAFIETYQRVLDRASEVVSIHISAPLSGTLESAHKAAAHFGDRVMVFDSKNLAWGEALQVIEAARSAAQGASAAEVLERIEAARERVRMIVGLDSLENLARGGRIGRVAAFVGGILNLKITLTVNETGTLEPVARTRGAKAALEHTLQWIAQYMGDRRKGSFAVMHVLSPDKAAWLEARLRGTYQIRDLYNVEAGSVLSTHTGTGWGVALLPVE